MSRRPVSRRRRNPDDDVLFPYAERFSSETFPSLTYPDYKSMHVEKRGSSARLPAPSESLVLDAFFDNDFASLLENPRRRSNGLAEYQRKAPAAKQMKKKVSSKKRPVVQQVAVVEREDGFRVVVLFRDTVAAMDGETELQMYTDWVRDSNEIESEHPMSRAEAMRLATEVASEYRYGRPGKIVVHTLRAKRGMVKRGMAKRAAAPKVSERVTYAAEEYMDNPRRSNPLKGSVEGDFLVSRGDDGRVRAAMRLSDVAAIDLYKHSQTKTLYTEVKSSDGVSIYVEDTPEEVLRLIKGSVRSNPAKKAPASKKKAPAKRRAPSASRAASKAAHLGKATAEVMHEDGAYEVITAKGKKFSWDELRHAIGAELLEFVPLGGGRVMVVNEEGRMHGGDINPGASLLVRTAIFGPAVVLARSAVS